MKKYIRPKGPKNINNVDELTRELSETNSIEKSLSLCRRHKKSTEVTSQASLSKPRKHVTNYNIKIYAVSGGNGAARNDISAIRHL